MNQLNQKIISLVAESPKTSSEICNILKKDKRETVRSAISRLVSKGHLYRARVKFAHGDTLISLDSNFVTPELVSKIVTNRFYGRETLYDFFRHMCRVLPSVTVADISKLAVLKIGEGPEYDWSEALELMESLVELGIVTHEKNRDGDRWVLNKELVRNAGIDVRAGNSNVSYRASYERVKSDLAKGVGKWLMHNNFIAPNPIMCDLGSPIISYCLHPFDFLGFSYSVGIASRKKGQVIEPKAFVGDILLDVCTEEYARSFISRVRAATGIKRSPPVPFILAKGFKFEVFSLLKQEGILIWTIDQLMGKGAGKAIQETLSLCDKLVRRSDINPNLFLEALEGLENFEGVFGNLKGKLFEMMIAFLVHKMGYENIQMGRPVPDIVQKPGEENRKLELDIFATRGAEALFVECKGLLDGNIVDDTEVEKHFIVRTSMMRNFNLKHRETQKQDQFRSVMVTSGAYSDAVMNRFAKGGFPVKEDTELELWDRAKLCQEFKKAGVTDLIDALDKYYSKTKQ